MPEDKKTKFLNDLKTGSPQERKAAAVGLWAFPEPKVVCALIEALGDKESSVRMGVAFTLGRIGTEEAIDSLSKCLLDSDESVDIKWLCARALGRIGSPIAVSALISALHNPAEEVQLNVCIALSEIGDPSAIEPLYRLFKEQPGIVRWDTARALYDLGAPYASECLNEILHDPEIPEDLRVEIPEMLKSLKCSVD